MKLYICIFNRGLHDLGHPDDETILYAEEWPLETDAEKTFAELRDTSLNLEARQHGVEAGWTSYSSFDGPFSWEGLK